jgi:hypothetical protein
MIDVNKYGALVEKYWLRKINVLKENLFFFELCSSKIPYGLGWELI